MCRNLRYNALTERRTTTCLTRGNDLRLLKSYPLVHVLLTPPKTNLLVPLGLFVDRLTLESGTVMGKSVRIYLSSLPGRVAPPLARHPLYRATIRLPMILSTCVRMLLVSVATTLPWKVQTILCRPPTMLLHLSACPWTPKPRLLISCRVARME